MQINRVFTPNAAAIGDIIRVEYTFATPATNVFLTFANNFATTLVKIAPVLNLQFSGWVTDPSLTLNPGNSIWEVAGVIVDFATASVSFDLEVISGNVITDGPLLDYSLTYNSGSFASATTTGLKFYELSNVMRTVTPLSSFINENGQVIYSFERTQVGTKLLEFQDTLPLATINSVAFAPNTAQVDIVPGSSTWNLSTNIEQETIIIILNITFVTAGDYALNTFVPDVTTLASPVYESNTFSVQSNPILSDSSVKLKIPLSLHLKITFHSSHWTMFRQL